MELDDKSERLNRLLSIGAGRGYVLYDEIDEFLTWGSDRDAEFDQFLSALGQNGIDVIEDPKAEHENDLPDGDEFFTEKELQALTEQPGGSQELVAYLREALAVPRLTREEESELARRIQDGEAALKRLIEANLYLMVATTKRRRQNTHNLLEMIQEGNIGLMIAARNFNHKREYRFSTYAVAYIRRTIKQFEERLKAEGGVSIEH